MVLSARSTAAVRRRTASTARVAASVERDRAGRLTPGRPRRHRLARKPARRRQPPGGALVHPRRCAGDPAGQRAAGAGRSSRSGAGARTEHGGRRHAHRRASGQPLGYRLTGLLSAAVLDAAAHNLAKEHAEGSRWLLIVADIDRLRDVNGLYGFGFGDELLRQFARRLSPMCVAPGMAARVGGDRFALLVPALAFRGQQSACHDHRILARPFRIAGCELILTLHAGAALFPDHGNSFHRLMRAAEQALESARRDKDVRGSNVRPADQPGRDGKQVVGEGVAQCGRA